MYRRSGLTQHAYFLSRDLSFLQDQEPILEKELKSNVKTPTHEFKFRTHIWNPQNWVITKSYQGTTEVVPTVVHPGYAKTLSFSRTSPTSSDRPVYLVTKETVLTNSTKVEIFISQILTIFFHLVCMNLSSLNFSCENPHG